MPSSKKTDERNELKIRLEELHDQLVKSSHVSAADKDMLGSLRRFRVKMRSKT